LGGPSPIKTHSLEEKRQALTQWLNICPTTLLHGYKNKTGESVNPSRALNIPCKLFVLSVL